jgi:hypothetical protein
MVISCRLAVYLGIATASTAGGDVNAGKFQSARSLAQVPGANKIRKRLKLEQKSNCVQKLKSKENTKHFLFEKKVLFLLHVIIFHCPRRLRSQPLETGLARNLFLRTAAAATTASATTATAATAGQGDFWIPCDTQKQIRNSGHHHWNLRSLSYWPSSSSRRSSDGSYSNDCHDGRSHGSNSPGTLRGRRLFPSNTHSKKRQKLRRGSTYISSFLGLLLSFFISGILDYHSANVWE